ncbi:PC6 [Symbiodinium natans]|uniref:PC6 protein n=1 Tax=Symbiodinium natans TaxID=878477 RepID=A0A812Q6E9_9DINO|nr:PC6 [Symbiodinium natans]
MPCSLQQVQHGTECKDSAFLTPFGTCEYTCPPGLYPFGIGEINITCQPCSPNCDTCDTYEVCTACKNDKFLNPDGACRDICPDGYWQLPAPGGVGNSCPLCSENCSLCTSPTVCQECRNSTYLSHYNWCEDECQDGYFEEGVNDLGRVCKVCPPTCNKCEAEDHCTECKYSTFLTHYQACETTCPPGYYPNRTRAVGATLGALRRTFLLEETVQEGLGRAVEECHQYKQGPSYVDVLLVLYWYTQWPLPHSQRLVRGVDALKGALASRRRILKSTEGLSSQGVCGVIAVRLGLQGFRIDGEEGVRR